MAEYAQVHTQLMFLSGFGYPMWIPEPNSNLPSSCREEGVMIGDVGIVTPGKPFDLLFNVCETHTQADDSNRLPSGTERVELQPDHISAVPDMFPPETVIKSASVRQVSLNAGVGLSSTISVPS